ncbi:adenylyltransferase/cytidyltransferase family protein [Salicibibacter kimchii]|uniref:Riboflavin biosynthesis protein n=1 Tax=Salicibibacter kimchii TaxID=2099786 RepID=A0A345C1F0_9BACI|nr:adenylyltransferase/cytidyltransferase family protein [Salicibibacter kimchii]AXF57031.1 hypothetical protein DT065_14165 [Salicibibacter kimchii]
MEVIHVNHADHGIDAKPHVMAVGFFDGVHLGHQELLNHAKELAKKNNVLFSVMTFSPHPDEVIKGDNNRKYLSPLPQKIEELEAMGVDKLFVTEFDKTFASIQPADFIQDFIVELNAIHVVVGFDFTFGHKAKGNVQFLQEATKEYPFSLSVIPKKTYLGMKISSTLIREMIQKGKMDLIPYYLGSHYNVSVNLIRSKEKGRLAVTPSGSNLLPNDGSYYVEITQGKRTIQGEYHQYPGMENAEITSHLINRLDQHCSLKFLSKIESVSTVSV